MRARVCGIYQIRNIHTRRVYIGKSVDIYRRWVDHRRQLNSGTHGSAELQRDWAKFGESAFVFEIREEVSGDDALADAEALAWATADNPYNDMTVSGSRNFANILLKSTLGRALHVKWENQLKQNWERKEREFREREAACCTPYNQLSTTEQAERERYLAIWKPGETPSRNTHET